MLASTTRSIVPPLPCSAAWCGATGFPAAQSSPCATARQSGTPPWPALARTNPTDSSRKPRRAGAESDTSQLALVRLSQRQATTSPVLDASGDIHKANVLDVVEFYVLLSGAAPDPQPDGCRDRGNRLA